MKKVVSIILFIILILVCLNVKADSETSVNASFIKTVNKDNIVITIRLGEFVSVEENSVMAAEMTLDFDNNVISKVKGTSSNGWDITIKEDTKKVLLETDYAKSNTEIAKIIFEINPEAETQTSSVGLKEINIAASASGLDEYYNDQTISFTANEETTPTPGEDDNNVAGENNIINNNTASNNAVENTSTEENETNKVTINSINTTSNKTNSSKVDNTTSTNKLPDTGIRNILIIAIVIVAICIVIFKIKSRKIKY